MHEKNHEGIGRDSGAPKSNKNLMDELYETLKRYSDDYEADEETLDTMSDVIQDEMTAVDMENDTGGAITATAQEVLMERFGWDEAMVTEVLAAIEGTKAPSGEGYGH